MGFGSGSFFIFALAPPFFSCFLIHPFGNIPVVPATSLHTTLRGHFKYSLINPGCLVLLSCRVLTHPDTPLAGPAPFFEPVGDGGDGGMGRLV